MTEEEVMQVVDTVHEALEYELADCVAKTF
jgi:hypothetical protein